ncbi:MAG: cold-shock protein [Planctomycetota bacterium]|jgi:CspA family cold shock protein
MTEGKVKWYDKKKGYGFVLDATGANIFVHYTCFSDPGLRSLTEGQTVTFEIVAGEKGPRAQNLLVKEEAASQV